MSRKKGKKDKEDMTQYLSKKQHAQAATATDEMLASTNRMLKMTNESKDIGIKTLQQLEEQGDQLRRVEGNVDRIDNSAKKSNRLLRKFKITGNAKNVATSAFYDSDITEEEYNQKEKLAQIKTDHERNAEKLERERDILDNEEKNRKKERWFNLFNEDEEKQEEEKRREREVREEKQKRYEFFEEDVKEKLEQKDRNLDLLGDELKMLKLIAVEAGDEIGRQSETINSIEGKVDKVNPKIEELSDNISSMRDGKSAQDQIVGDTKRVVKQGRRAAKIGKLLL